MIQIDPTTMSLILNRRIRQREIQLPVQEGKLGERKKPSVRPGSVIRLVERIDYQSHRRQVVSEPSRARAVLRLIDLCSHPKQVTVTVRTVSPPTTTPAGLAYRVGFEPGDHAAVLDTPLFMGRGSDYTTVAARAIDKTEVMMPLAADLEKARRRMREQQVSPLRRQAQLVGVQVGELRRAMVAMKARNRLRRIEHDLRKLDEELSSEECVDCALPVACEGQHTDVGRHHRDGLVATPELAA